MRWFLTAVFLTGIVCTVRCQEEEPQPSVRIMARSNVFNVNETKAIFCRGENLLEPLQWYSPSGALVEGRSIKNNRIYVESKKENSGEVVPLFIHHIKISDGGNWTCRSGNASETRDFIVGEKVIIAEKNITIEVDDTKPVRLPCEAKGYPTPVVAWYKDKQPIREQPKKYTIRQDHSLEIKKLNYNDVGVYTCKVRQKALSHYTEKIVRLSVQHKPIIYNSATQSLYESNKYKVEEVYGILNDTKNITCSAIANPPPQYSWFKRDKNLFDIPITDPDTVMSSEDGLNSVFVLRMYNESYFGEYKCVANNIKGSESILFHVSPGSKPNPPDFASLYSANLTELTFNVTCANCTFADTEELSTDPATILGFSFQLVQYKEGYDPDWTAATIFEVNTELNSTLYTVGPLNNNTQYHAQVRTKNAAGYSDWVDIPGIVQTKANAIKLIASGLVFIAFLFTRLY